MKEISARAGSVQLKVILLVAVLLLCGLLPSEALADSVAVTVSGEGVVQDPDPDVGIFCTEAGEQSCQFDPGPISVDVNLMAIPQPGWLFQDWGGVCANSGSSPSCSLVVMGTQPGGPPPQVLAVSATFILDTANPPAVNLSVTLTGTGAGKVFTSGQFGGIDCPGDCSEAYPTGSPIALTASPTSPNSVFTGWQGGGCGGTGTCTVVMNSAQSVQANFENDTDGDGVLDPADQCPATPAGESVDAMGCGPSQLDLDRDGIANSADQCPDTPAGEAVDADGCSQRQLDLDGDGVLNEPDRCPDTPAGEVADTTGCSASQRDTDGDSVVDAIDQCPGTAAGHAVDARGCGPDQLDDDQDAVPNVDDQCPDTPPDTAVDASGCSEVQLFGNDLGDLPGLGAGQRHLGYRLDEICPQLVAADNAGALTAAQRDLRMACSRLKNRDTTGEQAGAALDEILLAQLPALQDYLVELGHTQFNHLNNRIRKVRAGGVKGISVAGLKIREDSAVIPGQVVQSAFEGLLGIGASEEAFSDFGKLGLFLQGDIGDGKRDSSGGESGYDFDSWNLTLGADYRFTETFFAGASVNYGHVDVDYNVQAGGTNVDHWAFSLYGSWQLTPNWYLDGLASYGKSDFELTRTVSYTDGGGQFSSSHRGDANGDQAFLGINTGYTWNRGGWRFGPVATIAWIKGDIDRYTERSTQGSEAWNFSVDDRDIESLRVSGGLQVDYIINTSFGVLIPGLRAAYVSETQGEDEHINVRLANNPYAEAILASDRLVVNVNPRDDSFFDASLNLSAQLPLGISGFVSYKFYSAYDNFSLDAYTIGLRWDKSF